MGPDESRERPAPEAPLMEMEWGDIREPGSYLLVSSGLIARIYAEDIPGFEERPRRAAGTVVRLLSNPRAPLGLLREIAERHGYQVNS